MRPIPILRKPTCSGFVRFARLIAITVAMAGGALASTAVPEASSKTVVETAADLPRLGYRLPVAPSRMLDDPEALMALADAVARAKPAPLVANPPTSLGTRGTDGIRRSLAPRDIAR